MSRHLNLMSAQARKHETARRCRRLWSKILVVVLLLLTPAGASKWWNCYRAKQLRTAASSQYEPIRQLKIENTRMKSRITAIRTNERAALALSVEKPVLALVGLASSAIAGRAGDVYLEQLEIEQDPIALGPSPTVATLALQGAGRDSRAIAELADSLRAAGTFDEVEVNTTEINGPRGELIHTFTIECDF